MNKSGHYPNILSFKHRELQMEEALKVFFAGIGGVFVGMTLLYIAILLIIKGSAWSKSRKESQ